jgi:hypothetical protein
MKVKALVSFSGLVTMAKGEEKVIKDKEICEDLLKAGYVEELLSTKKKVKTDDN